MKILHVVRRYGPVGGMERYVWELTRELRELGHEVEVLCEVCLAKKPHGIAVHELGAIAPRPRWLSLLRFGKRVARWLADNPHPGWLIHSHERLASHHLTTFHGPPFASVRDMPWWRRVSLRVAMQLFLERRELSAARCIVPNSRFIRQRLAHYYPELAHKLTGPVVPGVAAGAVREPREVPADGGVVGFVGKEWQRKGLPLAVEVVAALRRKRPALRFRVVGPAAGEVRHLFAGWQGGYELAGWSDQSHHAGFDVLLHPARAEPYGMVISEAMAARVPVVVSEVCGAAAHVTPDSGAVLALSAPVGMWADAVERELGRRETVPRFERSWRVVAQEYETIYRELLEAESK
ncbi:MAG: glycosyltransferase family 4 protein [Nitrosomonadales bacterium]|nr:glycosyltransferase family 4 protein [Nitrosomonadales bacterium]